MLCFRSNRYDFDLYRLNTIFINFANQQIVLCGLRNQTPGKVREHSGSAQRAVKGQKRLIYKTAKKQFIIWFSKSQTENYGKRYFSQDTQLFYHKTF